MRILALWRRRWPVSQNGDFDAAAIDDYSIVIWCRQKSKGGIDRGGREEEAFGQRAISPPYHYHPPSPSSGISGPIKGISIHPFPPFPSTPGMHQTGSDNPFYDCETDYGRQSWTKKYKTFGESMHDIKSGKITQKRNYFQPDTQVQ